MPFQPDCGRAAGRNLLVIGAAGGVGSMAIQLGRHAGFHVAATASRTESQRWCVPLGVDMVIGHNQPLTPPLANHGLEHVDGMLNLAHLLSTAGPGDCAARTRRTHCETPRPTPAGRPYEAKRISLHWQFMFTWTRFATAEWTRSSAS